MDPEDYAEERRRLTEDVMERVDDASANSEVIRSTVDAMIPVLVDHGWEAVGGAEAERPHDPGTELPPEEGTSEVRRGHDPGEDPPDDWP